MRHGRFAVVLVLLWMWVAVLGGCDTLKIATGTTTNVCDGVAESVICEACVKLGTTPEDIAAVLKVANLACLSQSVYTALVADAFLVSVQGYIKLCRENGVVYSALVAALGRRYEALPPEVRAAFAVINLSEIAGINELETRLLTDADYDMLLLHIARQRAIVAPFL